MNPSCPFCGLTLKLKTFSVRPKNQYSLLRAVEADFYVCEKDKKHWLRGASIMKATARSGAKPKRGEQ